jgi:hypothetical protein
MDMAPVAEFGDASDPVESFAFGGGRGRVSAFRFPVLYWGATSQPGMSTADHTVCSGRRNGFRVGKLS